ncbi:MAG: hypothetical protein PHX68_04070 [Alphaproteobacteria bacterium]|nr:hypothetical protein [Alphaproteobacteria bacterium]
MKKVLFLGACLLAFGAQAQYGGYEQRRNVPLSYHTMSPYASVTGGFNNTWTSIKNYNE